MSTLKVTNIQATGETASRAVSGVAAAWADVAASGASIKDSINISSIDDDGTGNRQLNLTSNMSSVDYSVTTVVEFAHNGSSHGVRTAPVATKSASSIEFDTGSANGSGQFIFSDVTATLAAHGDLA